MIEKKSTVEKVKVMQAFLNGEVLEMSKDGLGSWEVWDFYDEPVWNWDWCDYRIKEEDYTLDIPWELIQEEWKWAAMSKNGKVFLAKCEPRADSRYDMWVTDNNVAEFFLKISTPDTKRWDKTLTKRPEGV